MVRPANHSKRQQPWPLLTLGVLLLLPAPSPAVSCDTGNPCMAGTCMQDGTCEGTPINEGKSCDTMDPCMKNGKCSNGSCLGTAADNNTPCTDLFGDCTTNDKCHTSCYPIVGCFSYCMGDFKCGEPNLDNPCSFNCNPLNGTCGTFETGICNDECQTGTCVPADNEDGYECTNVVLKNNGTSCDDGNTCNGNHDTCTNGACGGSGQPANTNTPTHTNPPGPSTPTRTPTNTSGPPSPTRTPTATATVLKPCVGDCGNNGRVTIDDLVRGIRILLGLEPLPSCADLDQDHSGAVTVDELVRSVRSAVDGCIPAGQGTQTPGTPGPTASFTVTHALTPSTPTHTFTGSPGTPTRTRTPTLTPDTPGASPTDTATPEDTPGPVCTPPLCGQGQVYHCPDDCPGGCGIVCATPTPTAVVGGIPQRAAGMVATSSKTFLVIPDLLSLLLTRVAGGVGGSAMTNGDALVIPTPNPTFACPGGGNVSVQLTCFPGVTPVYSLTANNCTVNGGTGQTVTLNGSLVAVDNTDGHTCLDKPTELSLTIPSLTITATGPNGKTEATFTSVVATTSLSNPDANCGYKDIALTLTGTITVATKTGGGTTLSSSAATFYDTNVTVSVNQYATPQCMPLKYQMIVDGRVVVAANSTEFDGTYSAYTLINDETSGSSRLDVAGDVTADCFGTTVNVATRNLLTLADGTSCPTTGDTPITADQTDLLSFTQAGGVTLDLGDNGGSDATFPSCLDPRLYLCPAN